MTYGNPKIDWLYSSFTNILYRSVNFIKSSDETANEGNTIRIPPINMNFPSCVYISNETRCTRLNFTYDDLFGDLIPGSRGFPAGGDRECYQGSAPWPDLARPPTVLTAGAHDPCHPRCSCHPHQHAQLSAPLYVFVVVCYVYVVVRVVVVVI